MNTTVLPVSKIEIPAVNLAAVPAWLALAANVRPGPGQRNASKEAQCDLGRQLAELLDLGPHHADPVKAMDGGAGRVEGYDDASSHAYTLSCLNRTTFDAGPYYLCWLLLSGNCYGDNWDLVASVAALRHGGFCLDTRSDGLTGRDNWWNRYRYGWQGKENFWGRNFVGYGEIRGSANRPASDDPCSIMPWAKRRLNVSCREPVESGAAP